jgi:PKD repeat protein
VQFDGSGSSDWDGSINNRKWDFGDGSTGKGKKVEHVYTAAGTYNVIHTVKDDVGAKGSDSTKAHIGADGKPPVADAGGPYEGSVGEKVEFDGTGSNDPDGSIEQYKWDFGDGGTAKGAKLKTPNHTYESSGKYTVKLTVTNDVGETDSETTTAEIGEGNLPPVADAGGPYVGSVGDRVEFDGSGSNDPDGNIRSYKWDLGDGDSESGKTPDHKYEEPGTYTLTLKVADNDSAKASDETIVVILE